MNRKKTREITMKLLYQMTINQDNWESVVKNYFENLDQQDPDIDMEYIRQILAGIKVHIEELDSKIEQKLVNWKLERISKVNMSILRLSLYEIFYVDDIPALVSVNEAIELAKKYSDDKSPKFINGILNNYIK